MIDLSERAKCQPTKLKKRQGDKLTNSIAANFADTRVAWGAETFIGTGQIDALGVGATQIKFGHLHALIDITALMVRFQGESFRANTVPKARIGKHTLLILRARIGVGTVATELNTVVAFANKWGLASTVRSAG